MAACFPGVAALWLPRLVCSQGADYRSSDGTRLQGWPDERPDADRGSRPPGRGFPVSQGRGPLRRRSQARRHAARGGAAQSRGAWPHPQDRCVGGARHARRACGHDRSGDRRRRVPVIPLRLANLPEFKNYLQPVIASDKVRYVGEPMAVVVAETQGLAEDALEAIEVDIERLPALPDRHAAAADKSLLFDGVGSNRAVRYDGDVRRRRRGFRQGGIHPQGNIRLPPPDRLAAGDPRADFRMGCGQEAADGVRRDQGAVLQPPHARADARRHRGRHRHDRGRRRRRLRRQGRVLSRGFPDSVRGAPGRPPGEMDRGPPRASRRDQPFARGRLRAGDRLQARRHDPRHARACLRRHGRLYPHQRRRGAGQGRAVPAGAVSHPRHRADGGGLRHQQDAGRHLARAGPVRGEFLPRAVARHRRGRPRPRSDGVPAQESDQGGGAAVPHRQARALRAGDRFRHRRLSRHVRARGRRDRLGQEQVDAGQADRRALSRACRGAVRRKRRLGQGEFAAGDREGRLGQRLCRLLGAGAGAGDDAWPRSPPTR